jgi:hypothetical protein
MANFEFGPELLLEWRRGRSLERFGHPRGTRRSVDPQALGFGREVLVPEAVLRPEAENRSGFADWPVFVVLQYDQAAAATRACPVDLVV